MRTLAALLLVLGGCRAGEDPADQTADARNAGEAAAAMPDRPGRWRLITAGNGDSSFVDTDAITDSAGARTVRIRWRWQSRPGGRDSAMMRYAFRCSARALRTWEETAVVSGSIRPGGWSAWAPVEPATWGERAMRVSCDSVAAPPARRPGS